MTATAPRRTKTTAEKLASARMYLAHCQYERTELSNELADPNVKQHRKDWILTHGLRIADMEIGEVKDDIAELKARLAAETMPAAA